MILNFPIRVPNLTYIKNGLETCLYKPILYISVDQCFFFFGRARQKCPCKLIFWIFALVKSSLHAHFFPIFWQFSRPLCFRTPTFIFCTSYRNHLHGHIFENLPEKVRFYCLFEEKITKKFARALFDLHGKTRFLRALFRDFSCFYTGTFFLHGSTLVLHIQRKKHWNPQVSYF